MALRPQITNSSGWHLIYTMLRLVENCGNSVHVRLNLIAEAVGDIEAKRRGLLRKKINMLSKKDMEDLDNRIQILRQDIRSLRADYTPCIEDQMYDFSEATRYENAFDSLMTEVKCLVEEYQLLSKEELAEISLTGASWEARHVSTE
ncbi:MAG: hypothetical protein D4R45_03270 [Planctomycetaceae bacterium]|nr:MAG: hypothetical protein D4R45_03270 [Planctomycetaceae bacterium]